MPLNDDQRAFLFKLLQKFTIIEIRAGTTQWRMNQIFIAKLESYFANMDAYDAVKKATEDFCQAATSNEEVSACTSFVMEYAMTNYDNVRDPRDMELDVKYAEDIIDYLIAEEKRHLAK